MDSQPACIFCQIANHTQSAKIYHEDGDLVVFQDTRPVAPVHILIIPTKHIASINSLSDSDFLLIGKLVVVAKQIAKEFQIDQSGYRLVFNTGPDAGQSVNHIHLHLIGGRQLPFRFE
jgi:histidine triad (HIT) family protein